MVPIWILQHHGPLLANHRIVADRIAATLAALFSAGWSIFNTRPPFAS